MTPLQSSVFDEHTQPFQSDAYCVKNQHDQYVTFHDVFSLIRAKTIGSVIESSSLHMEQTLAVPFSPILSVSIFVNFLSGRYYGEKLMARKDYLITQMHHFKQTNPQAPELLLFEGIIDIMSMIEEHPSNQNKLIFSIKKITDFAK